MSKELIERLRRHPWAHGNSTDPDRIGAADRIEELERENNELAARIGKELNEENLALRAEIAELVAALEQCNRYAKATLPTGYLALFTGQVLAKVR